MIVILRIFEDFLGVGNLPLLVTKTDVKTKEQMFNHRAFAFHIDRHFKRRD